jgi:hypothetical protein
MPNPTGKGGFLKGQSGNPGGRPKSNYSMQERCRALDDQSIAALEKALENPRERVAAASILLAYGHGRPLQTNVVRQIRDIADLTDAELAAIIGSASASVENDSGTRH